MVDPAAAAAGSTTFIALGKGTASHWHGDALRCEAGHERRGGGLFLSHETGVSFRRKIFFLNGPVKDGGGIYLYDCHDVTIARCIFLMNFAKWGGGVYLEKCSRVRLRNNLFIGNCAIRDGGAVSVSHSDSIDFERNVAVLNLAFRSSPAYDIFHSTRVRKP